VLITAVEQMLAPVVLPLSRRLQEGSWVGALSWAVRGSIMLVQHTPWLRLAATSVPLTIDGLLRSSAAVLASRPYPRAAVQEKASWPQVGENGDLTKSHGGAILYPGSDKVSGRQATSSASRRTATTS